MRGAGAYPGSTFEAGRLYHIEGGNTGSPEPSLEALLGVGMFSIEPSAFIPEHHGVLIMEAQRRTPGVFGENNARELHGADSAPRYGVGGFIEHTTVAKDRVTSRVLKRWPDQVGKLIVPEPVGELQLRQNRKVRRAAVAQQRRAA